MCVYVTGGAVPGVTGEAVPPHPILERLPLDVPGDRQDRPVRAEPLGVVLPHVVRRHRRQRLGGAVVAAAVRLRVEPLLQLQEAQVGRRILQPLQLLE